MVSLNELVQEARKYSEAIVTTISEPLVVLDKNFRIKSANNAFYKGFQINEAETEGLSFFELGNGQWNIPELRLEIEKILTKKTKLNDLEVSLTFPAIGRRVLLFNGSEMLRENGDEKLLLLAIDDITEKATAIKKIEDNYTRYHDVLMQSPFAFSIMKGKEMKITLANNLMKQFWGKGDGVEGKNLLEVLPEFADQPFPAMLEKVYATGKPIYANEILARLQHNDKMENRYFNLIYQPHYEADDKISGVITIAHEITEQVVARKKMEAQANMVHDLLMNAPGFVVTLVGPDHVYELVNQQYQSLFGKRQIQGKPIMEALPELKGQGFDLLLDKVYNTGKPYVGIDVPIMLARDEGLVPEQRFFNFSYQPMYDENKRIYSILVFGYEVTDQVISKNRNLENEQSRGRDLEEKVQLRTVELIKANEDLKKINSELESFTFISSHDLQEPVRKILTFCSLLNDLEKSSISEAGNKYIGRIVNSANRMQTLIEDLLEYSHTTRSDHKVEKTDLNDLFEEVKKDLQDTIDEKGAVIDSGNLCTVEASPFQIRQLLLNLLSNALKFSVPGQPPRITINAEQATGAQFEKGQAGLPPGILIPEREYCHLTIQDNGIGFKPEYSEQIFRVFQRLHSNEKYEGTGIGLTIVKKIVANHGGFVTASGEEGKGAKFEIYLPH